MQSEVTCGRSCGAWPIVGWVRTLKNSPIPAVVFGVAVFLLLVPVSRLDFDLHHDGYVLAGAIGVHEGLRVHTDVFAQYGPVLPWVQSLSLFLPVGNAFSLRLLNAALIAVGAYLLADSGRRTSTRWPVTRAVGWWAAISWVVLADVWLAIPMLPWSSTLAAVLLLLIWTFVSRAVFRSEMGSQGMARLNAALAGSVLPALIFTRLNVGIVALAGLLIVGATLGLRKLTSHRGLCLAAGTGVLVSFAAIAVPLTLWKAWSPYTNQAVVWAYSNHVGTSPFWALQGPALLLIGQLVPIGLYAVWYLGIRFTPVALRRPELWTWFIGTLVVVFETRRIFTPDELSAKSGTLFTANRLFLLITQPNDQYLALFMSLVVGTIVFLVIRYSTSRKTRSRSKSLLPWALLTVLAAAGLVQTAPTWDPRHIWWGLPPGLLLLFSFFSTFVKKLGWWSHPLLIPILAASVMSAVSGWNFARIDRVEGADGTLIDNMYLKADTVAALERQRRFLAREVPQGTNVIFISPDGYLSVIDGRWRSHDPYFVSWGNPPPLPRRTKDVDFLVVQRGSYPEWKSQISEACFAEKASTPDTMVFQRNC